MYAEKSERAGKEDALVSDKVMIVAEHEIFESNSRDCLYHCYLKAAGPLPEKKLTKPMQASQDGSVPRAGRRWTDLR